MRCLTGLYERDPQRVTDFRQRLELFRAHLEGVGLTSRQLGQPYRVAQVLSFVCKNLLWLMFALPLAVWGFVCHGIPYLLTDCTVKWLGRTEEEIATDKLAAGFVLYPGLWTAEALLAAQFAGMAGLAVFAILLVPSGLLALAWRERLDGVARQVGAFIRFIADRKLHERLLAERRTLITELGSMMGAVPASERSDGE